MQQPVENIAHPNGSYLVFEPSIDAGKAFVGNPTISSTKQLELNSTNSTANDGPLEPGVGCRASVEGTSGLCVCLLMSTLLDGISPDCGP